MYATIRTIAAACSILVGLVVATPAARAQEVSTTLSLGEAIDLARRNNPDYLIAQHATAVADWNVREAYGALLPGASLSGSMSWQGAGNTSFGIFNTSDFGIAGSTSYYYSSYNIGLSYRLSGATLFGPSQAKSSRRSTEAQRDQSGSATDYLVTQRYLAVLGAQDGVTLAREELARAEDNLRLAEGRVAVGAGIPLDQRQAEVERGRAQVALLQAQNSVETSLLGLWEAIGVRVAGARLTTRFEVADIDWKLDDLIAIALRSNPELVAGRADVEASGISVKSASSSYFPSLTLSAGWSGFAREAGNENYLIQQARSSLAGQQSSCELYNQISAGLSQPLPGRPADCSQYALTPALEDQIRSSNKVFPFDFTKNPMSVSLNVSLPVFQGFSRQRQIEQAKVVQSDAEQRLRKAELRIRSAVETNYLNVVTNRQAVDLESRNLELANDQLRQARERYRVGASSYLELREAEAVKARADRAHLSAVYAFHDSLSALEAAVGRPLRQTSEAR